MHNTFNKLATEVIAEMAPKQAAALDLHDVAYKAVVESNRALRIRMEGLLTRAAKMMAKHKFVLDENKSYLWYRDWTSGDGLMLDGRLFFKDVADQYRSEDEGRKIFDAVLGVWPTKVYGAWDEWEVHFGK